MKITIELTDDQRAIFDASLRLDDPMLDPTDKDVADAVTRAVTQRANELLGRLQSEHARIVNEGPGRVAAIAGDLAAHQQTRRAAVDKRRADEAAAIKEQADRVAADEAARAEAVAAEAAEADRITKAGEAAREATRKARAAAEAAAVDTPPAG